MDVDTIVYWFFVIVGLIFIASVAGLAGYGVYQVGLGIIEDIEDHQKAKAKLARLDAAKAKRDASFANWQRERAIQAERDVWRQALFGR